jgi:peptide/nickel transport system substrate-binding protein
MASTLNNDRPDGNVVQSTERTLSRRFLLGNTIAFGLTMPTVGAILAACGADNDEPTTTAAQPAVASPTNGSTADPTATTGAISTTATATTQVATTPIAIEETPGETPAGERAIDPDSEIYMGFEIEPAPHMGGTLVEGIQADLLYPYLTSSATNGWGITETLLEYQPETGELFPCLAVAWEASEDAGEWTFSLREGVVWHDGTPFTAGDVQATYEVIAQTLFGQAGTAQLVAEVEVVDDFTIRMVLVEPLASFADYVTGMMVLPTHILDQVTEEDLTEIFDSHATQTGSDPAVVIGTGPFKFKEIDPGSHVIVVRNDDYWAGPPYLDEIIFRNFNDQLALTTALQSGEVDTAGALWYYSARVDPGSLDDLETAGLVTESLPGDTYYFFMFNLDPDKTTMWQDKRIRQALYQAVDRQTLLEAVLFGHGQVAHGTLSPAYGFDPAMITVRYDYDPEVAGGLLDEAGWVMGADGIREKDGEKFRFPLHTRPYFIVVVH